jgi:Ni/Co efflux regulator RcnB
MSMSRYTLKPLICSLLALALGGSGVAYAQERGDRTQPSPRPGQSDRQDMRGDARDQRDQRADRDARGAGPNHSYRKGDRLPTAAHNRRYVVNDWNSRHLSAPPRGYHWVQTGDDYVLVAITTGIIMQLLLAQ